MFPSQIGVPWHLEILRRSTAIGLIGGLKFYSNSGGPLALKLGLKLSMEFHLKNTWKAECLVVVKRQKPIKDKK